MDSKYSEVDSEKLDGLTHIDSGEIFALDIQKLSIEEAWNMLSENHEITKGKKPNVVILDDVLSDEKNAYEFFEALAIILSDGGTLVVNESNDFSTATLNKLANDHDLEVVDIEKSQDQIRWYLKHKGMYPVSPTVVQVMGEEESS